MKFRAFKPLAVAATAALALAACATATPYQPAGQGSRYGYSDMRLQEDRYRVTFAGNSVTSREQVEMAIRAARWKTMSTPLTASSTLSGSVMSPATICI
jgi:hypothetical protein